MTQVKVYTGSYCPFCTAAKNLLKTLNIPFEEINLDDKPDLRMELSAANNGWRTIPMVFVGETFVGGFDDLQKIHKNGELTKLLEG